MSALERLDLERYSRQIALLRANGQLRLLNSTVAVVGLGGLGSIASMYLAAAGVGRLILIDKDMVERNNLNRQLLYTTRDEGKPKSVVAAERLAQLNPDVEIEAIPQELDYSLAAEITKKADVVVDALDNWSARLILDMHAWRLGKPLVHAAVEAMRGQATTVKRGVTGCLACIAPPGLGGGCNAILGPLPGILGSLEALEAIKIIAGVGEPLYNKLLYLDASRGLEATVIPLKPAPCERCLESLEARSGYRLD